MKRIFQSLSSLFNEQSGKSMILFAFCMLMIIGFTAFVVDVGGLYFEKSRLQKSLDAAVLGGAQVLKVSEARAKDVAIDLASQNKFTVSNSEITTGENFIEIQKTVNKQLIFARLLGFNNADVSAYARAETMNSLIEGEGIVPVALEKGEYVEGAPYTMHFQAGNPENASVHGNFGFLAINGPGGKDLKEGIMYGSTLGVFDPDNPEIYEWTKTGLSWGNVRSAFEYRIEEDADKLYCSSYQTSDNTCSRVVTVPLVESWTDATGKTMVKIIGFAAFWIESVDPTGRYKAVNGRFIDFVRAGTFGPGEDYGIYGVKLVK